MKALWLHLFAIISICLGGCAATGPKYSEMDSVRRRISPGKARLYFLRESRILYSGRTAPIKINGEKIGTLEIGGFLFADLAPGTYRISTETWDAGRFSIRMGIEAEKAYYIEVIPREEFLETLPFAMVGLILENKGMFALVPVAEEIAAPKLPDLRYSR